MKTAGWIVLSFAYAAMSLGCTTSSVTNSVGQEEDTDTETGIDTDTGSDSDSGGETDQDSDSDTDTGSDTAPPIDCGDDECGEDEDAENCPEDCPPICGDDACTHAEDAGTCPEDCPAECGDGSCTHDETAGDCPEDCEGCGDSVCAYDENFCTCAADCPDVCDDECCSAAEDSCTCPDDCVDVCGDDCCSPTESFESCEPDCTEGCGDSVCQPDEDSCNCPADCEDVCGDDCCSPTEDYCRCPADCPTLCQGGCCFLDEFTGSTAFTEVSFPFGDPFECGSDNEVVFSNTGETHNIYMGCFDEAELRVDLGLPSAAYTITVIWGTENDAWHNEGCEWLLFDDEYGATCETPNRIITVNGELIYENTGEKNYYSTTVILPYDGAIDTLALGVATAGTAFGYDTWYDSVEITSP
jgi:hypothetical protein